MFRSIKKGIKDDLTVYKHNNIKMRNKLDSIIDDKDMTLVTILGLNGNRTCPLEKALQINIECMI